MARKAPKDWANAVPKEKAMWAKENHKMVFLRPSQLSDRKPAAQLIRNTCETQSDSSRNLLFPSLEHSQTSWSLMVLNKKYTYPCHVWACNYWYLRGIFANQVPLRDHSRSERVFGKVPFLTPNWPSPFLNKAWIVLNSLKMNKIKTMSLWYSSPKHHQLFITLRCLKRDPGLSFGTF